MSEIIKQGMTDIWASSGDIVAPDAGKVASGWLVEVVPRQYWNWMQNRTDVNLAYMLQHGIPEWDAITEFIANKSYVQHAGIVYKAILTGINQNPVTATTYWKVAFATSTAALEALKETAPSADKLPYFNSATTATTTTITPLARTLLDDTTQGEMLTTVGAQPVDATLTAIAGVTTATNKLPYFSGVDTATVTDLTAFGRSLLDDVDAGTARATLGLGTIATQDANAVTISGGSITGITDLAIADGGTGASNAATARTNLGLGSASTATVTTSTTDTTAGRVLKVGDFGLGGTAISYGGDLNLLNKTGFYRTIAGVTNIPPDGLDSCLVHSSSGDTHQQICTGYNSGVIWGRGGVGYAPNIAWTPWTAAAGLGQTWQDVTASRLFGTTYLNTTGRTITVDIALTASTTVYLVAYIDGTTHYSPHATAGLITSISFAVPPGGYYQVGLGGGTGHSPAWTELR